MKKSNRILTMIFLVCFVFANVLCFPTLVSAKEITSSYQAKKLAREKVKGATVTEVDRDYEKGELVYEVKLVKGKKEYELTYRASDAKLIAYKWEIASWYITKGKGKIISKSKCKKLAKKEVSGGSITSLVKKRSDGIDIYKVKMKKGSKKYPVYFSVSDTSGEKEYEEFFTAQEAVDMERFVSLGVVTGKAIPDRGRLEGLFKALNAAFKENNIAKDTIVAIMKEYLPDFQHIETGKSLDSKM